MTTIQLEFRDLSRATGNPKYEEAVAKVSQQVDRDQNPFQSWQGEIQVHELPKTSGLVPIYINANTGTLNQLVFLSEIQMGPWNQWWCGQGSSGSTARSHWVHGETLTTSTCSSKYEAGFHTCGYKHFYLFSGSRLGRLWTIWNRTTMNLWRGWDCDFFHGLTETLAGDEQAGGENGAEQSSLCRRDPRRRQGLQAEDGRAGQNEHY